MCQMEIASEVASASPRNDIPRNDIPRNDIPRNDITPGTTVIKRSGAISVQIFLDFSRILWYTLFVIFFVDFTVYYLLQFPIN